MHFNFDNQFKVFFEKCTKIQGFGDLTASLVKVKKASGEGSVILGTAINERNMILEFDVDIEFADEAQRFFKPGKKYELVIGNLRKINCVVVDSDLQHNNSLAVDPTLSLGLYAPDPYFYDVSDFGENIAGISPQFGFPWVATIEEGIEFGYKIFSDRTIFSNDGDKDVGFRVIITAEGQVVNPRFENLETGKFIQVNTTLNQGDVLEISSVLDNKYIRKNGENIYADIDRLSDYFYLQVGDNKLKYSAETGLNDMSVILYYSPAYQNGGIK